MKRTTYIIFGMLLAGLLVVCSGIFYSSTQIVGWSDIYMDINGEQKTVQLPECKVVQLIADREFFVDDKGIKEVRMVAFSEIPLNVRQAQAGNGTFTYASDMDKYMMMTTSGDTLRIAFSFPKEKLEKKFRNMVWLNVRSEEMKMTLPDNVQALSANLVSQKMNVEGFNRDSLSLMVLNYATINDCYFRALTVQNGSWLFNSGKADSLHLHLNGINNWNVNVGSFHIDTEYLYAHGNSRCVMGKGECRQVVWMPQSDGASLNIELKQAARVVVE